MKKQHLLGEFHFNSKKPFRTIIRLFSAEKKDMFFSAVLFIVKHSPSWALPIITAHIINKVSEALQNPTQKAVCIQNIVVSLILFGVLALQNIPTHTAFIYFLAKAVRTVEGQMRLSITRRLQQLSVAFHEKTPTGAIQSKILRDVESIRNLIMVFMNVYLPALVSFLLAFSVTLTKAPIISALYFASIPVVFLLVYIFRRRMNSANVLLRQNIEKMTANITEMIAMLPVTKAHGLEKAEEEKMQKEFNVVCKNGLRLDIITAVFGAANWVAFQLLQVVCFSVTVPLAFAKKIEPGDIILYQGFFNLVLGSVSTVITMYPEIIRGFDAVRSIGEILESQEIEYNERKQVVADIQGEVCFNNVHFSYDTAAGHTLYNVSFRIKKGKSVAFVGESGSGKSTVMQLILGLRHPQQGTVTVDGYNLTTVDLRSYRKYISIVPQSVVLFSGSIKQNISYGLPCVSDSKIYQAAQLANALEFIEKLPNGFDTQIGESGAALSGGQRQRIAIARALIRDPSILIFDEATSALDVVSEKLVQDAVDTLIQGRTCFIVAHRLATVRNADRIFVMKAGRIVEEGSYAELSSAGGEFARLRSFR